MPQPNPTTIRATFSTLAKAPQINEALHACTTIKFQKPSDCPNAPANRYDAVYDPRDLHHFKHFQTSQSNPDEFTLSKLLSTAANLNALDEGKQMHAFIVKTNASMDVAATNALLNLYCKCDSVGDAEMIFHNMRRRDIYTWTVMVSGYILNDRISKAVDWFDMLPRKNLVTWNSVISAYQRKGYDDMALKLFGTMRRGDEGPNHMTFIAVLKACACLRLLEDGEGIHCYTLKSAWIQNVLLGSTLIDMYAKCGDIVGSHRAFSEISEHNVVSWSILLAGYAQNGNIVEAEGIFHEMPEKNVISWNVMITGYVQNGRQGNALELFVDMIKAGIDANRFTFTSLLSGCSVSRYAMSGRSLHGRVLKAHLHLDTPICNAMITMYGGQGDGANACRVFDMMPQHDVVSWTAIVAAFISANRVDEARGFFDRMPEKNLISWNTMMSGYLQKSSLLSRVGNLSHPVEDALTFFYDMERSVIKPDHFSYNCALTACASIGALEQSRAIHCKTSKRGYESDLGVGNALITAYGKSGSLSDAEKIFNSMANPDLISWNALLTAYSQNGRGNKVLDFYAKMQKAGMEPNHITFVSLLSTCSYIGDVTKGQEYFSTMEKDYGISPCKEHYACMVDLLGRAGFLVDAEAMFTRMSVEPDAALWGALLGACKIYGNHKIAKRAADHVLKLDPDNSSAHVALAETFAAAGMWDNVVQVRTVMKEKRILKEPGCSWIEIRSHKHIFLSGDYNHLQKEFIYSTMFSLYSNMVKGCIQDLELVDIE